MSDLRRLMPIRLLLVTKIHKRRMFDDPALLPAAIGFASEHASSVSQDKHADG